ncbi:MAG: 50S ribosomal protein L24 [Ruminococcus sp.]|nr:50S ribosomal protein L24 [Ruminococcus sp.]
MNTLHVKKGDTVVLLTGKYGDKYTDDKKTRKTGKVLEVSPKEGKVIVEGINFVTKHVKPRQMGQAGSIVKTEAPVYACKVMAVCPKCGKPTKPSYKIEDGKKTRCCKKCGAEY